MQARLRAFRAELSKIDNNGRQPHECLTVNPFPPSPLPTPATAPPTKANALGMRPMQERAYEQRGEQYLLIKSPPASGKSRALMFIALDKLPTRVKQAIIVVPEKSIGASFHDEPLTQFGFWADWTCRAASGTCATRPAGTTAARSTPSAQFLASGDKVLVCTHATSASRSSSSAWRRSTTG